MTHDLVEKILHTQRRVLMYQPEHEDEAREVMARVALQLAKEMSVSDPSLECLVIVDKAEYQETWKRLIPAHITTVAQLANGDDVLSRHQSIVALAPDFARRNSISTPLRSANRLYAMTPNWKSAIHLSTLDAVMVLEDAA